MNQKDRRKGVNDSDTRATDLVLSYSLLHQKLPGSVAKVLHQRFGIEKGLMTTVHAYQTIKSSRHPHEDLEGTGCGTIDHSTTTGAERRLPRDSE